VHRGEGGRSGAGAEEPLSPGPWAELGAIRALARAVGCPGVFPGKPSGPRATLPCARRSCSISRYHTTGKPSLSAALTGKARFPFTSNTSIYFICSCGQGNNPSPCTKSTCAWFITPARLRARRWGWCKGCQRPSTARRGATGRGVTLVSPQ